MYLTTTIAKDGEQTLYIEEEDRTADYAAASATTTQPHHINTPPAPAPSDVIGVSLAFLIAGLVQTFQDMRKPGPACVADDPRWKIKHPTLAPIEQ